MTLNDWLNTQEDYTEAVFHNANGEELLYWVENDPKYNANVLCVEKEKDNPWKAHIYTDFPANDTPDLSEVYVVEYDEYEDGMPINKELFVFGTANAKRVYNDMLIEGKYTPRPYVYKAKFDKDCVLESSDFVWAHHKGPWK